MYDGCHHFATSDDGGATWEELKAEQCVPDPGVEASLLADGAAVLMASPLIETRCGDHLRGNLTLYRSSDGGTWDVVTQVHADCSGYSSMAPCGAGRVCVVWSTEGLPRVKNHDGARPIMIKATSAWVAPVIMFLMKSLKFHLREL